MLYRAVLPTSDASARYIICVCSQHFTSANLVASVHHAGICVSRVQAEKQAYLQLLEQHGIKPPALPGPAAPSPVPAAATAAGEPAATVGLAGSLGSNSSSSAALMAQLMLMRMQSVGAAGSLCQEQLAGSPHMHLPPGTPPVQDTTPLADGTPPMSMIRRSHSLDSHLNSLTGGRRAIDRPRLLGLCSGCIMCVSCGPRLRWRLGPC